MMRTSKLHTNALRVGAPVVGALVVTGALLQTACQSDPERNAHGPAPAHEDPTCIVAWVGETPIPKSTVDAFKAQAIPAPSGDEAARWAIDVIAAARAAGLDESASIGEQRRAYGEWFQALRRQPSMTSDGLLAARESLHVTQRVRRGPCAPQAL